MDISLQVGGADEQLAGRLSEELSIFNNVATGAGDEEDLSVRVTDASGDLIAGLTGWTWGGTGGINMTWVHADHRRAGWGSRMVMAAEDEARRRGCSRMVVSSFTYQAPDFYRGHGYVETGRTEGLPDGSADVHFLKHLDDTVAEVRVRLAVVIDFPVGHEAAGQAYEDAVLPLLGDHGGRLEQRLRADDGMSEIHLISFSSRAGYEAYLADPRRAAHRERFLDFTMPTRVVEVSPVTS